MVSNVHDRLGKQFLEAMNARPSTLKVLTHHTPSSAHPHKSFCPNRHTSKLLENLLLVGRACENSFRFFHQMDRWKKEEDLEPRASTVCNEVAVSACCSQEFCPKYITDSILSSQGAVGSILGRFSRLWTTDRAKADLRVEKRRQEIQNLHIMQPVTHTSADVADEYAHLATRIAIANGEPAPKITKDMLCEGSRLLHVA